MDNFSDIPGEIFDKLQAANQVVVLTWAGVSAESGVPTFRGSEGLWRNFKAEDLATLDAFIKDPSLVWEWYNMRRETIAPLNPNPGHLAIAEMEHLFPQFTLITQNVDGLHKLGGSTNPVEMHGNIWKTRCIAEGTVFENRDTPLKEIPPHCPDCGEMVRPHIVWFGESLDTIVLSCVFDAAKRADIFFVVGSSSIVQPAASLAHLAKSNDAMILEFNLEPTMDSDIVHSSVLGPSGETLPKFLESFKSH